MVDVVAVDARGGRPASATSWGAIFAGAAASIALTILLLAIGSGLGFSTTSAWPGSGISAKTFAIGTGLYLIVVAMLSSTIGGYIAGRLRSAWTGVHTDEVFFRDTAHGFTAWAVATIVTVGILGSVAGSVISGTTSALTSASAAAAGAAASTSSTDFLVDGLFRANPTANTPNADPNASRAEVGRIVGRALLPGGQPLAAPDRTYVAQIIANRTGISQADAEKRIDDGIAQAREAADTARKTAAGLSLWFALSLLIGAFSASFAAAEAGKRRDDR